MIRVSLPVMIMLAVPIVAAVIVFLVWWILRQKRNRDVCQYLVEELRSDFQTTKLRLPKLEEIIEGLKPLCGQGLWGGYARFLMHAKEEELEETEDDIKIAESLSKKIIFQRAKLLGLIAKARKDIDEFNKIDDEINDLKDRVVSSQIMVNKMLNSINELILINEVLMVTHIVPEETKQLYEKAKNNFAILKKELDDRKQSETNWIKLSEDLVKINNLMKLTKDNAGPKKK